MPNVVSVLSVEEYTALKGRARSGRRSLGAQLAAEAFAFAGLRVPDYLASAPSQAAAQAAEGDGADAVHLAGDVVKLGGAQ
jgi:hypothetical protein